MKFQSTLPAGGATYVLLGTMEVDQDFNPRSPRGERHYEKSILIWKEIISIHAPRGGSDQRLGVEFLRRLVISIHAPRGGSDHNLKTGGSSTWKISIHAPRGGSDDTPQAVNRRPAHFNPRSPRGERLMTIHQNDKDARISIHAPRGGSDVKVFQ